MILCENVESYTSYVQHGNYDIIKQAILSKSLNREFRIEIPIQYNTILNNFCSQSCRRRGLLAFAMGCSK